ncbi:hypothetical protein CEE37_05345 [candidate division LCP-89 bacterium B3_LCP]|uniref:Uncharacterized protein n=1 Tax=candidate division LCP-89 bacterium B3_LCP TaxID=2012998 RepID=A0A532V1K3_UNCL8|nr:MAG: hypothetical protein CEE37_05345 [candidate division LCP-89 bacterium B3_LCP]
MKKQLLIPLLVVCLCAVTQIALADDYWDRYKNSLRLAEKIEHPIFEKVFPGVEFRIAEDRSITPKAKKIIGLFEDEMFLMTNEFNFLYAKVVDSSKANVNERIEAFIRLGYWLQDPVLKVIKQEEVEVEKRDITMNHRTVIRMMNYSKQIKEYDIFIVYKSNLVMKNIVYCDGKLQHSLPLHYYGKIGLDEINLDIYGDIEICPWSPEFYNYLIVEENGLTTGNSFTISASGLPPDTIVQVKINEIEPYSRIFLNIQGETDTLGNLIPINWTPIDNETGICEVQIQVEGTWYQFPDRLIPENHLTNRFWQGYGYTVYYCDGFFQGHPNGMPHGPNFAERVRSAAEASWSEEVVRWELCEGIPSGRPRDDDGNYQVFINDAEGISTLNYHGTDRTGAIAGSERRIGIGSLMWQNANYWQYWPESDLINSVISHEFYHGIQWSHNQGWQNTWGPEENRWMLEGQARFIQTVFMEYYSDPNEEFEWGRRYQQDSNEYLNNSDPYVNMLNISLIDEAMDYEFCIFWRFLYENYINGTEAEKLAIIRETCIGNSAINLSDIETFMNLKLSEGNGTYSSMDEAIAEFARRAWLNDPEYGQWNPCPSDSFFVDPRLKENEVYTGGTRTYNNEIPYPFCIDYLAFHSSTTPKTASLQFDGDPDNDGNMASFYVHVMKIWHTETPYVMDESSFYIHPGEPTWQVGTAFEWPVLYIVAVARLDTEYNIPPNEFDYEVTLRPPTGSFLSFFGGDEHEFGSEGHEVFGEGYIIVGSTTSSSPDNSDIYLIKTNQTGSLVWDRTYGDTNGDYGSSVQVTSDGGYIIAGSTASTVSDVYLIKTNGSGTIQWTRTFGGANADGGGCVQQTTDGGYIISGNTTSFGAGSDDIYLIKTNELGEEVWSQTFGGPLQDTGGKVRQTYDGGYIVAGTYQDTVGGLHYACLFKTDENGLEEWSGLYGGQNGASGFDVQQTYDGGYIISGSINIDEENGDFYLVKTDTVGNVEWSRNYGGELGEVGQGVDKNSDGGYVMTGWTCSYGDGLRDILVVRTDEVGHMIGQYVWGDEYHDWGHCVEQTYDGGFVVTGETKQWREFGPYDIVFFRLHPGFFGD